MKHNILCEICKEPMGELPMMRGQHGTGLVHTACANRAPEQAAKVE